MSMQIQSSMLMHYQFTMFYLSHQCQMCHYFQYFWHNIEIFWNLFICLDLIPIRIGRILDADPDPDPAKWSGFGSKTQQTCLLLTRAPREKLYQMIPNNVVHFVIKLKSLPWSSSLLLLLLSVTGMPVLLYWFDWSIVDHLLWCCR